MGHGTLSPRELEILTWAAKGKTYWETARILGIAYASVHSHVNSLRLKLNAVNTTHAVARGYGHAVPGAHPLTEAEAA
jgi:DNA-binding CsgD family transcriptional regulator